MKATWQEALKYWRHLTPGAKTIPKKGTPEYEEVRALQEKGVPKAYRKQNEPNLQISEISEKPKKRKASEKPKSSEATYVRYKGVPPKLTIGEECGEVVADQELT